MKLWLSKNSEVPVRAQLIAQVTLGIASGDLAAGEKLPSTRELARRFDIHQNTVSSAYRELAAQGFAEFKKGSGVYVTNSGMASEARSLDALIAKFFLEVEACGFTREEALNRLCVLRVEPRIKGFLVAEPNAALGDIIVEEITAATGLPASVVSSGEMAELSIANFQLAALFDEADRLRSILPPSVSCIYLKANSVPNLLSGRQRPSDGDLIGIASQWEDFLKIAKLFLVAARVDPETIITCSGNDADWKRRMKNVATIVCDSAAAKIFRDDARVVAFRLISDASIEELRYAAGIKSPAAQL